MKEKLDMRVQRGMENNLYKFLWRQYLNGNFYLNNIHPDDIYEKYQFKISQEDLDDVIYRLSYSIYDLYADSQLVYVNYDGHISEKIQKFILNDFDESKYYSMNKKELTSLIHTYKGGTGIAILGENLIEDIHLRVAVYFHYLSRYVE
jgi:hypothetical protein